MLERLDVFIKAFNAPAIERLSRAPWPSLTFLRVANSSMKAEQVRQLADRLGPQLEGLEVAENPVDARALLALCEHGLFRGVHFVANRSAGLTDESIRALAECPMACNLTSVFLDRSGLTDAGFRLIIDSPHLRNRKLLFVGGNRITDEGVEALANSSNLKRLERLRLDGNPISDRGVQALARSPNASGLYELSLDDTRITTEGALAILDSPHLRELSELFLQENRFSPEGRQRLRSHFGQRLYM